MRRWIARHWRGSVLGVGGLIAVGLFAVLLAQALPPFSRLVAEADAASVGETTPDQRLAAIDAVRGRILEVLAGLGFLGTLLFTLLTYRLSLAQHRTGHIGRAVAQLGAAHAFERTGGVLELEQIMRRWPGSHSERGSRSRRASARRQSAPRHAAGLSPREDSFGAGGIAGCPSRGHRPHRR